MHMFLAQIEQVSNSTLANAVDPSVVIKFGIMTLHDVLALSSDHNAHYKLAQRQVPCHETDAMT